VSCDQLYQIGAKSSNPRSIYSDVKDLKFASGPSAFGFYGRWISFLPWRPPRIHSAPALQLWWKSNKSRRSYCDFKVKNFTLDFTVGGFQSLSDSADYNAAEYKISAKSNDKDSDLNI